MAEFTFQIDVEGLADPRLDDLGDLHDALVQHSGILGPALAGNLETGALSLIVTAEAASEQAAATLAAVALGHALVETKRTESVARLMPALAIA